MVTAGIFPFKENSHGRAGNRTRDLMISSQRLWPLDWSYIYIHTHTGKCAVMCSFYSSSASDGLKDGCSCTVHGWGRLNFHTHTGRTVWSYERVTNITMDNCQFGNISLCFRVFLSSACHWLPATRKTSRMGCSAVRHGLQQAPL